MARTDRQMIFMLDQAITTGTQMSDDTYDSGVEGIDINRDRDLSILATVSSAFAGGTNLKIELIQSSSSDMSNPDVLASSPVVVEADLKEGKELLRTALPRTSKRYLGMRAISTGTHTAGTVWGGVVTTDNDTAFPAYNTGL